MESSSRHRQGREAGSARRRRGNFHRVGRLAPRGVALVQSALTAPLNVNGKNTAGLSLLQRKALLTTLLPGKSESRHFSDVLEGDIRQVSKAMQQARPA